MLDLIVLLAQALPPNPAADADPTAWYSGMRIVLITISFGLFASLLTMYSFLSPKLKESVYDSEEYAFLLRSRRAFNPNYSANGALRRWTILLFTSMAILFVSGMVNLAWSLWPTHFNAMLCVGAFGLGMAATILTAITSFRNIMAWLNWSARKTEQRIAAQIAADKHCPPHSP